VAGIGWYRTARAHLATSADLAGEQAAHAETMKANEHLENRMRSLRNELADAHHTIAELTDRLGRANPTDASRALGLWALERHRQARIAGTPLLGLVVGPGTDLSAALVEAIQLELEVLREEVGTHAGLAELDLGDAVEPHEALTILRIVQELTATLAKRADDLSVEIGREDADALVVVSAHGWTDTPPNASAFEHGLAALDGTLHLRPHEDDPDTLVAIVRLAPPESP
jgi:hypothetical protein